MDARVDAWCAEAEAIASDFTSAFGNITPAGLNWKPNPGAWSIAQVTDHLITVSASYFDVIESHTKGSEKLPWFARFRWLTGMLGRLILRSVQPETQKKTQTFPIWQPESSNLAPDIIARFAEQQHDLCACMRDSIDLLAKGTIIRSPANRRIVYSLEDAFDIILAHQRRHWLQALRVKEQLLLQDGPEETQR